MGNGGNIWRVFFRLLKCTNQMLSGRRFVECYKLMEYDSGTYKAIRAYVRFSPSKYRPNHMINT